VTAVKIPKKLIEVTLPLDAINAAAAREKSIRHGHPSTLHLWWARRPLAAARAVIFAQMVNDPGGERGYFSGMTKAQAKLKRDELFKIIEDLVLWENTNNEAVLERARAAIRESWRETCELNKRHPQAAELFDPEKLPAFHDPFAGGGALPLEAQRLGLESYASDLNPVAVTINKAMIEIPPRFAGRKPVGPLPPDEKQTSLHEDWSGAKGLAEDVRRYGAWMRAKAEERIGHLYPKIEVTAEMARERADLVPLVGKKLTVIAWIWARTVKSPNPAYSHVDVPLASTFVLCSKKGKEAYVQPVIEGDEYRFEVRVGEWPVGAENGTKVSGRGANFHCLISQAPVSGTYIKAEGKARRMGAKLMAIVAEGVRGRVYIAPTPEHEAIACEAHPTWRPEGEVPSKLTGGTCVPYGLERWSDLFTARQMVALTTFSDLVHEAINRCKSDALETGITDDGVALQDEGRGAHAYAEAIGLYLAFGLDRCANYWSSLTPWGGDFIVQTFGRQAIPMVWDHAEANPLSSSTGHWAGAIEWICKALSVTIPGYGIGKVDQADAQSQRISQNKVISTDPPYYDNIGYADLSDFFYVWLRRCLRPVFPRIYATLAVPKDGELIAAPYRHGGKQAAEAFFLKGMSHAMHGLAVQAHLAFPVTIYYAFKQTDSNVDGEASSTGWETFLDAVLKAGFSLTGTWPIRAERDQGLKSGTNALASCIVLVCRKRPADAPTVSRRDFLRQLDTVLTDALDEMTRGGVNSPIAPVDLSQAIIGPGMAIFSQYSAVLESDGTPMSVRTALQLINRFLADDDFDADTHFCLQWFAQEGWAEGKYGEAAVLATAKGTTVQGLQAAGVVESGAGKLRLLRWAELPRDWSPERDTRTPIWEALHQLIRVLNQEGAGAAGKLLARMPTRREPTRTLAYRLFTLCERKGWAEEARAYNELVAAWPAIDKASENAGVRHSQNTLDLQQEQ
jgi:putative DNA methylase